MEFRRVCVVGVGLIGGSFSLAVRSLPDGPLVLGVDTGEDTRAYAAEHQVVDEIASPEDALAAGWFSPGDESADLVVLATPASVAAEWLQRLGESGYEGVVTDVASTKSAVIEAAEKYLNSSATFVGGHPMAGSELSGIGAARPDLFAGAYYVLTPTAATGADAFRRVHSFVSRLGARPLSVDAREHDEAVAIISHVPHVTASALVSLAKSHAGPGDELLRLAAGGFKDTTRIAAGSPDLWTGICMDNASAIAEGIDELGEVLSQFADVLRSRDSASVRRWLADAADVRRALPTQWVPASSALTELLVPMIDRPGVVSEITSAVGRAGCNIEAIEIDHTSEDSAVLVLVLTDEGDTSRLVEQLRERGYEPALRPLEGEL